MLRRHLRCLSTRAPSTSFWVRPSKRTRESQMHLGKTQVWNRGGHMPPGCDSMQVAVQRVDPHECGVVKDRLMNKGFGSWGSPSGMSSLFRRSSDQRQRCTGSCTSACRCKTCRVRGCSSSSTPMPGTRVRCVESRLLKLLILPRLMMRLFGSVS